MDWKVIQLIWTVELRTLLRSRRTIIRSVLLPILVMPLMLMATRFNTQFQERQQASTVYRYAIAGDWIDPTRMLVESAALALESDPESELHGFHYEETTVGEPTASVRAGEIDFYLETFSPESADLEWDQDGEEDTASATTLPWLEGRISGVAGVRIALPGNRANSAAGAGQMAALLAYGRRIEVQRTLRSDGFYLQLANVLASSDGNVATDA